MTKNLTIKEQLAAEKKRSELLFDLVKQMASLSNAVKDELYALYQRKAVRKPYSHTIQTLDLADDALADIANREFCATELMNADPVELLTKWQGRVPSVDSSEEKPEELSRDTVERRRIERVARANRLIADAARKNFEFQLSSGEEAERRQAELYQRRCEVNRQIAEAARKNFKFQL